ncbi:MAG: hypothetical protein ACI9R3_001506 [Verrucomicrobiales bacterium]|jgi:hypothetical protein
MTRSPSTGKTMAKSFHFGRRRPLRDKDGLNIIQSEARLAANVRRMIEQTREGVARTVNAGMTRLYRRIDCGISPGSRTHDGADTVGNITRIHQGGILVRNVSELPANQLNHFS